MCASNEAGLESCFPLTQLTFKVTYSRLHEESQRTQCAHHQVSVLHLNMIKIESAVREKVVALATDKELHFAFDNAVRGNKRNRDAGIFGNGNRGKKQKRDTNAKSL